MPFGLCTWVGPRNHVLDHLDRGPDPTCEGAIFVGKRGAHCKVQGLFAMSCAKTAEWMEIPFGMWTCVGLRKQVSDWGDIGINWQIRLNRPYATVLRPYVKLL